MTTSKSLESKIADRSARIVVVGIGYVGLPLVVAFAEAGFHVTGYDKSTKKVRGLGARQSYIKDVPSESLVNERIHASSDSGVIRSADVVVLCVPTPLNKRKDPDLTFIVSAMKEVVRHAHEGMLIILESTTYPGTTREVVAGELGEMGLKVGENVHVAFSPERVDPGNPTWNTKNTPKVVGGITPLCTSLAKALYETAIERVVPVSSPDVAEVSKLLENTYRQVNIALVNELAI